MVYYSGNYGRNYRRSPSPSTPASNGQRNFITGLLADKAVPPADLAGYQDELDGKLSKMRAGEIITDLKALPNRPLSVAEILALPEGDYASSERQRGFLLSLLDSRELPEGGEALAELRDSKRTGRAIDLLLTLPEVGGDVEDAPQVGYLAPVGERVKDLSGEVVLARDIESRWGFSKLLVVKLDSGHIVKTFSSAASILDSDFIAGDPITILAGTVKAHDDYQGKQQTLLTRVKVDNGESQRRAAEAHALHHAKRSGPGGRPLDPAMAELEAAHLAEGRERRERVAQPPQEPRVLLDDAPKPASAEEELDRLLAEFDS